jgi:hypothetical protein
MSSSHSHASTSKPSKKSQISYEVTPESVARSEAVAADVMNSNSSQQSNDKFDAAFTSNSLPVEFYDYSNEDNEKWRTHGLC